MYISDILLNKNIAIIIARNCTLHKLCQLGDRIDIGMGNCEALRYDRGKGILSVRMQEEFAEKNKKDILRQLTQYITIIEQQ